MNKNGWGLRFELFFIMIFLLCLVIAVIGINQIGLIGEENSDISSKSYSQDETYTELENEIKNAAKSYVEDRYQDGVSDTLIITSSTLINNGYLNNLYDKYNRSCSGYVKVNSYGAIVSFIKCPSYETSGYDVNNE